jgi:hypothetical protein
VVDHVGDSYVESFAVHLPLIGFGRPIDARRILFLGRHCPQIELYLTKFIEIETRQSLVVFFISLLLSDIDCKFGLSL